MTPLERSAVAHAQQIVRPLIHSSRANILPGAIVTWQRTEFGLEGRTTNAAFLVTVYNPSVTRVQITREDGFENFSYAVVAEPESPVFDISEETDHLVLATETLRLLIRKDRLAFQFQTPDGKSVNEDDPALATSWIGEQVTTYKKLQEGERFIGLGEKTGPLDRRGFGYTNWNTDNFGYSPGADPLYCSTPFYIGIHHGLAYGIFLDNTHKTHFNFGASNDRFSSFSADTGEMNYYFIYGENVRQILRHYSFLTGRMEMPPLWSLGYQQCRYSYYPESEVRNIARTFREKDIPADAIVLDIHYMEAYKIFTWSRKSFPAPEKLIADLREQGFHVVVICDPGIKVEAGYKPYEEGVQEDVFLTYPDGQPYTAQVWPGWCHFPDFTQPSARTWWKEQLGIYVRQGVSGFWNDMNEIATWGNMLPENVEMDFEGLGATLRRGRNVYGFQMARSTYEGAKALMNNERPFNLTRSGFSGVQRYAAVWTGDNVAYDEHMMLGVRMISSMGLAGIPFAGYDVGGFVGDAGTRLFARWISIGAFAPFFRGHSMINSRDSEPWSYGEEVEQIARNYIRFRYQLLPYLYSVFHEASTTGMPVQRSLAIDYTHDAKVYDHTYQHQYLLGPSILVAPVESTKEFVKVYFPAGSNWYALYDGQRYSGGSEVVVECPLHRLPVFIRESAVIPMRQTGQHTGDMGDTLVLHVYNGERNHNFTFYEDDGKSFDYQRGVHAAREVTLNPMENRLEISPARGSYVSAYKTIRVVLHAFPDMHSINVNGQPYDVRPGINQFFPALEKFDPVRDPDPAPEETVQSFSLPYSHEGFVLQW